MKGCKWVQAHISNSFWSICLAWPLLTVVSDSKKPDLDRPLSYSHEWLSLPYDDHGHGHPLSGWEVFEQQASANREEPVEPTRDSMMEVNIEEAGTQDPAEARIELLGYIEEGGVPVYCFFDTVKKRWFRLGVDQTDSGSGMRLAQVHKSGSLVLVDLLAGQKFLIGAEGLTLKPMYGHE